jgi:hypothetical protein
MLAGLDFADPLAAEGDQASRVEVARSEPLGGFPIRQCVLGSAVLVVVEPTLDKLSDLQRHVLSHGNLDF